MRIILTHEQADFDALASMLGAHLLDETVIPVIPHRMNRNVRAFITLYGAGLPFVERRDLPSEPIEAITLVDTQSMVSVKGYSLKTRVHVIDHHPQRGDMPDTWTMTGLETGANTTLFVETLREQDCFLTTIQATLLLMGIYEDTGSLTYTRTTSRDLKAAAYLLEEGANLHLAVDFLNHPLSLKQQAFYDVLRKQAETLTINGHTVILACGDAQDMDEELSTIAHKLRDLLDPDALILLIKTRGGIQLIARSNHDNIDVADLAAHFKGGGHSRAAAGLIHDRELEEVCRELISVLPEYVKPSITVANIMSRDPHVVAPDTPVDEVSLRMQRYGYEGYPVVRDGRVIGLLTRRVVDRAISHKLNLTAASLMEAGEVTIQPDDSIERLQNLMTETGWGQIPVVSPENGQIVGIVTRTDLLKMLTLKTRYSGLLNYADRLESTLSPTRLSLLKLIAEVAREQHSALYIVGGFVRDLILEMPSFDFDLVVEGDAIILAKALAQCFGGRVTSHSRFGTAKWFLKNLIKTNGKPINLPVIQAQLSLLGTQLLSLTELPDSIDLITARTEFYSYPTALPTVERSSIKLDLHRRDFTINTMALRLDGHHYGELYDYWGGLNDLRQEFVRCLHSLSFVEDPTRMLRAVRFEQRFGFHIEKRTLQLLQEALSLMDRISGDRVRHELDHILDEDRSSQMLSRLEELGVLKAIHPKLAWDDWLEAKFKGLLVSIPKREWDITTDQESLPVSNRIGLLWNGIPLCRALSYILWVIRLPIEDIRRILGRLKVARSQVIEILAASSLWKDMPTLARASPGKVVQRLDEVPSLPLYATYLALDEEKPRQVLYTYVTQWKKVMPITTGHDLLKRGLPPGPDYKRILEALRMAWLEGEVKNNEEENLLLEKLIK